MTPRAKAREKQAKPKITFMITPAVMIAIRAPTDLLLNARGSDDGVASSSVPSPSIFTYPPSGTTARIYLVSPRSNPQIAGPKPIENVSTLTWFHFARRKCPNSWTKMTNPSPSGHQLGGVNLTHEVPTYCNLLASPGIDFPEFVERGIRVKVVKIRVRPRGMAGMEMSRKRISPSRKRATAASLAAFRAAPAVPPLRITSKPRSRPGKVSRSGGSKVQ